MTDTKHPKWALPFWLVMLASIVASIAYDYLRGGGVLIPSPIWYYPVAVMVAFFAFDAWKKRKASGSD